jgi:hypothetical protein
MKRLLTLALLIFTISSFAQTDTTRVSTINIKLFNTWLQKQPLYTITGQIIVDSLLTKKFNYTQSVNPPPPPPPPPPATAGQYRYDATQAYKLNSFGSGQTIGGPMAQLQDNDTLTSIQEGYGQLLNTSNYWIPLTNTTSGVTFTDIKLYSYTGSGATPVNIYAWNNGVETLLASFTGGKYKAWIDYPIKNVLATRLHIVYTIGGSLWPTEMRLYGGYTSKAISYSKPPTIAFNDELGVNSFWWSVLNANSPSTIINLPAFTSTFTGIRMYCDWQTVEPNTKGLNTFAPSHSGSWNIDTALYTLKKNGIITLFDIKTQAPWMQSTWPNGGNGENIPVMYINYPNIASPSAYKEQARTAFQIAARYGATKVPLSMLTIDKTTQWTGDKPNVARTGLNTLSYIECDNERDKWWKGLNAFQNGYQYAANLSAFYDGDLGKLGTGYGVKTADPNMKVVYAGTADVTPNGFLAAIQWCKDNRGGKLAWNVFNVHDYAGRVNPEAGLVNLLPLIKIAQQYNMPIWLTETGYDQQSGSPDQAPAIGSKTTPIVQADWILRTVLWAARNGISRTFIYQDYDGNPGNPTVYATSGILSTSTPTQRKPAGDFLAQAKTLMAGFNFVSTNVSNGVTVDVYKNAAGKTCEVLFLATMTGASINFNAPMGTIYTPVSGASVMASKATTGVVTVTETPIFDMLN